MTCASCGTDRKILARGCCSACYHRRYRSGDLLPVNTTTPLSCGHIDQAHYGRGMCRKCYVLEYQKSGKAAEASRKWVTCNAAKVMWASARSRAKKNRWEFNIDVSDIVIPEYCPILGIKLSARGEGHKDSSPSLDCIVPTLRYVKGNVQVISDRANRIKGNGTAEEHELIAKNQRYWESKRCL